MANKMDGRAYGGVAFVLSVLLVIAGILAIVVPLIAGVFVTAMVAWLLILSGVLHGVFAWRGHGTAGVVWELCLGLVYVVAGGYMLVQPVAGLETLTLALAFYLFAKAGLECLLWWRLHAVRGRHWLLVDGVVTFVLAAMIWRTWPSSAVWVLGTLVGVSMILAGLSRFMLSMAIPRRFA